MFIGHLPYVLGFPGGSDSKESTCYARDPCSIPGSGRPPGEGNGNPLQILPGKSHRQRNLAEYRPWSRKESNTPEQLTLSFTYCMCQVRDKWVLYPHSHLILTSTWWGRFIHQPSVNLISGIGLPKPDLPLGIWWCWVSELAKLRVRNMVPLPTYSHPEGARLKQMAGLSLKFLDYQRDHLFQPLVDPGN